MSRRAQDPVERAFAAWVELTFEERDRFEDRRTGYHAAFGHADAPPKPKRARKKAAEAEGQ